jgi:hypothetical protein
VKAKKPTAQEVPNSSAISNSIVARKGIPYIPHWSEAIARICSNFDISIVFKPISKLAVLWGTLKTKLPCHGLRNGIYKLDCLDCEGVYIGESNDVERRIREHQADVRLSKTANSALANHAINSAHSFDFRNVNILANDPYYLTRKLSESYFIQFYKYSVNKHPGSLPPIYLNSNLFTKIHETSDF